MKQKYFLLFLAAFIAFSNIKAQFRPVQISGFNADIIANGVGDATSSTNLSADDGLYAMVAEDFTPTAGGTLPTYFLPSSRFISGSSYPGLGFQLADYSTNNSLRLAAATTLTETLTIDTPSAAIDVYLLAFSGSGSSTADITLNFQDGSQQTESVTVADWFYATPFVTQGIGRVNLTDNSLSGTATNPRLYPIKMSVDAANAGKIISTITVTKTNATTTSVLNILAVSFLQQDPNYSSVAVTGFNEDVIADGMGDPAFSTTSDVDAATPPYVFVAQDYQYDATCTAPARALPSNRLISNNLIPGMFYELAPYSGNNDLRLTGVDVGTLTFTTPTAAKTVYLLAVGGNGAARISATVTFTDNTTEFFDNLDIGDWYGGTTDIVTGGIGRLKKTTTNCTGLETSTLSPKLFQIPLDISSGSQIKPVQSVTITRIDGVTGFTGLANILAVGIANMNTLLPNKATDLVGYSTEAGNKLEWTTKTETNNAGFQIEKSADGKSFSSIDVLKSRATDGNSSRDLNYKYTDAKTIAAATAYYRIKQVDKDGKFTYSNIVMIKGRKVNDVQITSLFPNPARQRFTLSLSSNEAKAVQLVITDVTGKTVLAKNLQVVAGSANHSIDVDGLKAGTYFVKILCNAGCTLTRSKFVKY